MFALIGIGDNRRGAVSGAWNPVAQQWYSPAYLWRNQADREQTEGSKERPCIVVHWLEESDGAKRIHVVPITHTKPFEAEHSVECPDATKYRLGHDDVRSWIITSELKHFVWPGFDVKPTPDSRTSYGLLPNQLTRRLSWISRGRPGLE